MDAEVVTAIITGAIAIAGIFFGFMLVMQQLIHIRYLVNSRMTEVLSELSAAKNLIAELTKKPSDVAQAAKAKEEADYSRSKAK